MPKRIPFIDEAYWEKVNPYLSQLLTPQNGGINLWTNATQPQGLTVEDTGRTGWNLDAGCLQRWNGSTWQNLEPSLSTLGPIINQLFNQWNPTPPPAWLTNLILNTISAWNPAQPPTWLTQAITNLLNGLTLQQILGILNQWSPSEGSPVDQLLDAAATSGGLTEAQAISIINNWNSAIPGWLVNYITGRINGLPLSQLAGSAALPQLQTALAQWYNGVLKPYIDGLANISNLSGNASFQQVSGALDQWFNNNLKPYIDAGDANTRAYGDAIRASLSSRVDSNYADLLNRINTHGHAGSGTTPAPTQGTTTPPATVVPPPPTTTLPSNQMYWGQPTSISSAGGVAFVGTGIQSSGSLNLSVWIHDGNMGDVINVTIIKVPGKINGVNNIPSNITTGSLVGATGSQTHTYTLNRSMREFIGPAPVFSVGTPTASSDYGYNIYVSVNSATRYEPGTTAFKSIVLGFYPAAASSSSMTVTYTGASTDTRV